jgi:hypothetical protein
VVSQSLNILWVSRLTVISASFIFLLSFAILILLVTILTSLQEESPTEMETSEAPQKITVKDVTSLRLSTAISEILHLLPRISSRSNLKREELEIPAIRSFVMTWMDFNTTRIGLSWTNHRKVPLFAHVPCLIIEELLTGQG